ncbi:hypothetical protein Y032_0030g2136 [Ancylostoma ceylanicum]|uniref:Uncharacterized protein n=1 Tax=Ancylostoma ceylanicum TaxID=53326 RepID=A0A016UQX8_9BILA|nr:hypothetical protein Y032_0030g2136 [Ancylostoma ceylanicum]
MTEKFTVHRFPWKCRIQGCPYNYETHCIYRKLDIPRGSSAGLGPEGAHEILSSFANLVAFLPRKCTNVLLVFFSFLVSH